MTRTMLYEALFGLASRLGLFAGMNPYYLSLAAGAVAASAMASIAADHAPGWGRGIVFRVLGHPFFFISAIGVALAFSRWATILLPLEMNVDDSSNIALAMRFQMGHIPWKSVDPGTSGAVNLIPPFLALKAGLPATYMTLRLIAFSFAWGTLVFTYLSVRELYGEAVSKAATFIPACGFYFFLTHRDYLIYASESFPVFLLALGVYFFARSLSLGSSGRAGGPRLFFSGAALGAVPFTKLQGAPITLALACIFTFVLYERHRSEGKGFARPMAALSLGLGLVPILILAWVAAGGALRDFWYSYIYSAVVYSTTPSPLKRLAGEILNSSDMMTYISLSLAVCLPAAATRYLGGFIRGRRAILQIVAALIYLVAAAYSILKPGRMYGHYLLWLVHPTALLAAALLGAIVEDVRSGSAMGERRRAGFATGVLVAVIVTAIAFQCARVWRGPSSSPLYRKQIYTSRDGPYPRGREAGNRYHQEVCGSGRDACRLGMGTKILP